MTLTLTLANGQQTSWTFDKKPRHVYSWAMRQMPFDTDYFGCTWTRS